MPCVEIGPPGLRAALSQRCAGERKTDVALSRLGGRALAPVPRHPACRFGRGLRARVGNVQGVQRGAAVKVGFPIKPPDYIRGETAARGAVASYYG